MSTTTNEDVMEALVASMIRVVISDVQEFALHVWRGLIRNYGQSPGTPKLTNRATAGWGVGVGGAPNHPTPGKALYHAIPGDDVADRALDNYKLGQDIVFLNRVPYASILAGGRRPDKNGRMIGSLQAPEPFIPLALAEAKIRSHHS